MGVEIPKHLLTESQKDAVNIRIWGLSGGHAYISRFIKVILGKRFGNIDYISKHSYQDLINTIEALPIFMSCFKCRKIKPRDKVEGFVCRACLIGRGKV